MPFPMEILTMLGSGLMAGLMSIWSMKMKHEELRSKLMLANMNAQMKHVKEAREYKNPKFQYTRRIIALSIVFSVIVLPKIAALFMPEASVTVGYTEFDPGFWFFTDGQDIVKWVTATGMTLTPLDTHVMSAVVGLYFGASVVKNA